jgi:hypothetical protein
MTASGMLVALAEHPDSLGNKEEASVDELPPLLLLQLAISSADAATTNAVSPTERVQRRGCFLRPVPPDS